MTIVPLMKPSENPSMSRKAGMDGIASGLGYSYVLIAIAFIREIMGSGTLWGYSILGDWWTNWSIMVMAPGAFFTLAVFIWIVKGVLDRRAEGSGS